MKRVPTLLNFYGLSNGSVNLFVGQLCATLVNDFTFQQYSRRKNFLDDPGFVPVEGDSQSAVRTGVRQRVGARCYGFNRIVLVHGGGKWR